MKTKSKPNLTPYLYILPMIVICVVYLFYSLGFVAYTSFTNWDTGKNMKFIGLRNYADLFTDNLFWNALKNTTVYFFFCLIFQISLGILLAVLVRSRIRGSNIVKSVVFMPYVMSTVIIAAMFRIMMDMNFGDFNAALSFFGIGGVNWLGDVHFAMISLVIVAIFQFVGFHMVLYIGGLSNIPDEIFESARIDGAGFFIMLFRVTVPMLVGTIMTSLVFGIVGALKTFDQVFLLTNGGPGNSTELLSSFLYKQFLGNYKGGYASSIGIVMLLIGLVLSIIQIRLYNKNKVEL